MKILCCVKQVPEKDARVRIASDGAWIVEDGLAFAISECDRYGVEAALRLRESVGGEVAVLSLGDAKASKGIKEALAMGCDRAIHVESDKFVHADAITIARVIAKAIEQESFDLVLLGVQSDDLGYNAVGPALAQFLGASHVQIVLSLEPSGEKAMKISHELDNNLIETVELSLPAVLGVQSGILDVRYASLKGIMGAAAKPQRKVKPEELGLREEDLVSKVSIESLSFPQRASQAEMIEGDPADMAKTLVKKLQTEAKVL
jgi:electron transfer flavoprotein beta subunit